MIQEVLAYDLGGTKVAVGVVNSRGKVLDSVRVPVVFKEGKNAVVRQLIELGKSFLIKYPKIKKVGIGSAGPLDPKRGLLLDPSNFAANGKRWGTVPLVALLNAGLARDVKLENDAASAILAEAWVGSARNCSNAMILTLGTGLGTAVLANGELVRAGRGLHTEAGHLIIDYGNKSAACGCGNFGCAEAFLSGNGFTKRARVRIGNKNLSTLEIADLARQGNPKAIAAFEEYSKLMATALHNYVVTFAPEKIIFTGSFAAASDLFLKGAKRDLTHLLRNRRKGIDFVPKLLVSKLDNQAGLIGAARIVFF